MIIVEATTDRKLKYVEKSLLKLPLLKLEGLDPVKFKRRKPIDGLIFIINQGFNRSTLDIEGGYQCGAWRRRSAGDLFRIMKFYYPDITFKEVRRFLFELANDNKLNISYCYNINKQVYYKRNNRSVFGQAFPVGYDYHRDEFGIQFKVI